MTNFRKQAIFGSKYTDMFQYGDINQHVSSHVECVALLVRDDS